MFIAGQNLTDENKVKAGRTRQEDILDLEAQKCDRPSDLVI